MRKIAMFLMFFVIFVWVLIRWDTNTTAQGFATPTPIRVVIPTQPIIPTIGPAQPTPFPTFTPTEQGGPRLQLAPDAESANIRAEADPEAQILGTIAPGEQYEVTGRYFLWYQIRLQPGSQQRGYVFGALVEIIGDESLIPDLTIDPLPTQDPTIVAATQTTEAIQNLPGGQLTLTASVREIAPPGAEQILPGGDIQAPGTPEAQQILPTFTFPPNIPAQAPNLSVIASPTPQNGLNLATNNSIPPITLVVVFAGAGIIGLLLSRLVDR
ncbi:MAG: hypothetical protein CUN56_09070 [Phototrophicales bacterium]|nr:MAG: hypothetical protein CUN56_09070 [Phototrophicales bacterium]RMG76171.1 MAG: SH3 domain-containing protein [Chloroflexota bacterium]